jgi:hypothetical protein
MRRHGWQLPYHPLQVMCSLHLPLSFFLPRSASNGMEWNRIESRCFASLRFPSGNGIRFRDPPARSVLLLRNSPFPSCCCFSRLPCVPGDRGEKKREREIDSPSSHRFVAVPCFLARLLALPKANGCCRMALLRTSPECKQTASFLRLSFLPSPATTNVILLHRNTPRLPGKCGLADDSFTAFYSFIHSEAIVLMVSCRSLLCRSFWRWSLPSTSSLSHSWNLMS